MQLKNIFNPLLDNYYRIAWKVYDKLYIFTGSEKFYCFDEQAVYNEEVVRGSPIGCNLPFNFIIPYGQEIGNEYFVVCDHSSRFKCKKAAKISFYRPEYVSDNIYLGKKKWVFSR